MAMAPGCVCSKAYVLAYDWPLKRGHVVHEPACIEANERALDEALAGRINWQNHTGPCPDRFAHKAHGQCYGRSFDQT